MQEALVLCTRALGSCKRLVVLSGAGLSRESGIPTFRDTMTGYWSKYNPEELASTQGFWRNPDLVYSWYDSRRVQLANCRPNPGHYALCDLESVIEHVVLITQNVDGLQQQAGSGDVIELHGNINTFSCFANRHEADFVPTGLSNPPKCHCGSLLRPNVVWFGEMLDHAVLERATQHCREAEVILVVGTSGIVQPAASLPFVGIENGATVIEVNPEKTPLTPYVHEHIIGKSGEILPQLVESIKRYRQTIG